MKLGIHLPQYGRAATPDSIRRVACHAEAIGYHDVWVSDHLVFPAAQTYPSPFLYDPLMTLAWAAASTERIGLGTSVLVVPQYHPLQLANSLASLDNLSGGRLTVAVGVGWSEAEFNALGQEFHNRGARTDEAIDIMRLVWSQDPATFRGEFYSFEDIKVQPKPAHRIPIWVGGATAATYRRAVERGDGFHAISTPPERLAVTVTELHAARAAAGRTDDFAISYRTGWDPQGMDPGLIRDERDAYLAAGVEHVVSAPWRTTADDWMKSMDMLQEIVNG
jgi:probable F420-dependent oxidoreductase